MAEPLESHSYQSQLVSIASTGSSTPLSSNEPDVAAGGAKLEYLVSAGKDVIIVGHSYGSFPMCEAANGIGKLERNKRGEPGGVAKLDLCCSMVATRRGELACNH